METVAALKQLEGQLSILCDRTTAMKAKLEDLLFRAQRISSAAKNGAKSNDTMFGYDLQHYRRDIRGLGLELSPFPVLFGTIERSASYDEVGAKFATSVMRLAMRLSQSLRGLHDTALLAHQHIRAADHKVEAWYLAQEVEEMVMKGQGLPTVANKIVVVVSTRPGGAPPASPPAQS